MNYEKLIAELNDHADWADANIYEVPITLPDDLRIAAHRIKSLDEARERANEKAHECEGRCKMLAAKCEIIIEKMRGDCDYCKHKDYKRTGSPCWQCERFAAKERITGNYWEFEGVEVMQK